MSVFEKALNVINVIGSPSTQDQQEVFNLALKVIKEELEKKETK